MGFSSKEVLNILSHQGNANQNNPEIPPHTSQWLRLKIQMIAEAGEDEEKEEHFSTLVGL